MSLLDRLATIPRRVEGRVANPLVARVLRSRFHPLLSKWLLLLSYEGRRSGQRYTTPTLYRRTSHGAVLFTPAESTNWWRNFRERHPLRVLLRGEWRRGQGEVVTDEAAVLDHLRWLVGPIRRPGRLLGHTVPSEARLERAAPTFVLVRATLDDVPGSFDGAGDVDRHGA